ncbi:MAG: hypothetical protein M1817_001605 [Caeruleum heppii]|nr:MAG: hypothetical protein M1817_001605 [Caeruleum heppii]
MRSFVLGALALSLTTAVEAQNISTNGASNSSALPTVDLGYTVQQALSFNETGNFYNFSNIRFGEPPIGDLRFAAPVAAKENRSVQTGEQGRICYQAAPAWSLLAARFLPAYTTGNQSALDAFYQTAPNATRVPLSSIPPADPRETEDCLFLDVAVPKPIYDNKDNGPGAPVLVWIFGGGYTFGHKNYWGNPAGLLERSGNGSANGVVYVSINYRLGAFGWLGGPSLQANGTANAGLYDQRLALEWVQQNIKAFGGDPKRVTVVGESAGGGSIMHQITAYGGLNGPAPFQQAVPQSAGWFPQPGNFQPETSFQNFLNATQATSLQDLRAAPASALRDANSLIVTNSPYGQYGFGPVVDGTFVPALPGELLAIGAFDKNIKLMIGYQENEGLRFTSPFIVDDTAFEASIAQAFPSATDEVIAYITGTLYPPVSPSTPYNTTLQRAALLTSEATFSCNTYYLSQAYSNNTYNYLFSIGAALHGNDIPYTFYNGPNLPSVTNDTVAIALQNYITSFVATGTPNEPGVPQFDPYTDAARIQNLDESGIDDIRDPASNARCAWWQKALYY